MRIRETHGPNGTYGASDIGRCNTWCRHIRGSLRGYSRGLRRKHQSEKSCHTVADSSFARKASLCTVRSCRPDAFRMTLNHVRKNSGPAAPPNAATLVSPDRRLSTNRKEKERKKKQTVVSLHSRTLLLDVFIISWR